MSEIDLAAAIKWVTESGVQNANGAFYAWYDREKGCYSFLYPEVTGYAIQFLVELYKLTRKRSLLQRANAAGDWLLKIQREDGTFNCRYFGQEEIDRCSYVFDASICLSGFLSLFEVTSDKKFLKPIQRVTEWLLKSQYPDGSFIAGYDPKNFIIEDSHWSRTSACHHLKNVLVLQKLYKVFGKEEYFASAKRLMKWGLGLQQHTGRFRVSRVLEETYTHSHCYAVEGLLKATKFPLYNSDAITESIVRAAKWLSSVQNDDGSIWNYYNSRNHRFKTSDVLAQAIRIWTLIEEYSGVEKVFEANIRKGVTFLGKMQCLSNEKPSFGGICYGKQKGERIEHVNTWATLFASQAMLFLEDKGGNPSSLDALF